ncbi:MAG TPA: helix-turn-helix transcriptional regulator [Stenomitos sp.]
MEISSAGDLGAQIRKARKEQGLTQADLAGASGVGVRFVSDLEAGKPTCELDKALKVVRMLGLRLQLEP